MLTLSPFLPQSRHDDEAVPIRWQCPQAVTTRVYTAKSDVYSFGVLLFEIYSGGGKPYAHLAAAEVVRAVMAGELLSRPSASTPEEIVQLIRQCTLRSTSQRPSMATVSAQLHREYGGSEDGQGEGEAASGIGGFALPGGMAVNPAAGHVLVAGFDAEGHKEETSL